jgi:hypothetical protein
LVGKALAGTTGTPAQAWPMAGATWGQARTKEVQRVWAVKLLGWVESTQGAGRSQASGTLPWEEVWVPDPMAFQNPMKSSSPFRRWRRQCWQRRHEGVASTSGHVRAFLEVS